MKLDKEIKQATLKDYKNKINETLVELEEAAEEGDTSKAFTIAKNGRRREL